MSKFNDRMLEMEKRNAQALDTDKYVVVRLDGQNFHSYHQHFGDHFSDYMQDAMNYALLYLMEKVPYIAFGYTNSDEMKYRNPLDLETILTERGVPRLSRNGFYYGYFATNRTFATGVQVAHGRVYEIADVYL